MTSRLLVGGGAWYLDWPRARCLWAPAVWRWHYFIEPGQIESEIDRVRCGRNAVVEEIQRLQEDIPADAPQELTALLDVHLMLLRDEMLTSGVKHWITDRPYNAEWALDHPAGGHRTPVRREMEDEYLRERKADLEQVVERILRHMKGVAHPVVPQSPRRKTQQDLMLDDTIDVPWCWWRTTRPQPTCCSSEKRVCRFPSPTWVKTSHTAIVARSMDIPPWWVRAPAASWCVRMTGSSSMATPGWSSSIRRPSFWPRRLASARSRWSASA